MSPDDIKQRSPPHKQEAHPTPSIMQQSWSPGTNKKTPELALGELWWACESACVTLCEYYYSDYLFQHAAIHYEDLY